MGVQTIEVVSIYFGGGESTTMDHLRERDFG
jgi:hypothetical protein